MEPILEEEIPGLKTRNYVNLNNLKKGNYYFYNGKPLGYFNELDNNSLVFSDDKYDENTDDDDDDKDLNVYPIINIGGRQIPSTALLEEVEPQTIHLEDVSVHNIQDYLGGKRRKSKKNKSNKKKSNKKSNKKSKKRYSRKYR
jgi:hypothetical protein